MMEPETGKENKRNRKRKQPQKVDSVVKQPKLEPLPLETNVGVALAKDDRQRVFRLLWIADDQRNFSVIKQVRGRVMVAVDGYRFTYNSALPNGSSLWRCEMKLLHKCTFCITITADGKIASFTKGSVHTHQQDRDLLLDCPLGKGLHLMENGEQQPFWLITNPLTGNVLDRHLIYQNYKYALRNLFGLVDASEWLCSRLRKCPARCIVQGIFKVITVSGIPHNHPPMSADDVQEALRDSKILHTLVELDVVTPFRELQQLPFTQKRPLAFKNRISHTRAERLAVPVIYHILAVPDPERNFEVLQIKENLYKIRFERHDYKFSMRMTDGSTLWKCLWESIHNCTASITLSKIGQRAQPYGHELHCHPTELAPIFDCELTKHSVLNVASDASETIRLLARECSYFESRSVIFQKHVYNLYQIDNQTESRWFCVRPGSNGQQCPALLVINGPMESFLHEGHHCDPPMSDRQLERIVLPGNMVDLLDNLDDDSVSAAAAAVATTIKECQKIYRERKEKLFDYPLGRATIWNQKTSRSEQFHFVRDHARKGDAAHVVFHQNHRYSFASIDEFGVSQWVCSKLLTNIGDSGACHARITIEGVFQQITAAEGEDLHEVTTDYLFG